MYTSPIVMFFFKKRENKRLKVLGYYSVISSDIEKAIS